jgi:hypothetical protein
MDVGGCELTGACDNQVVKNNVKVLAAEWSLFGVLRESTTMAQNNGYSLLRLVRVGESGESTQGSRRNWSRKLVRATMVAGWEIKVKGPWINQSVLVDMNIDAVNKEVCPVNMESVLSSV